MPTEFSTGIIARKDQDISPKIVFFQETGGDEFEAARVVEIVARRRCRVSKLLCTHLRRTSVAATCVQSI